MSNDNNNNKLIGDHPVWDQWDRLESGLYVVATGPRFTVYRNKFFVKIFEPKDDGVKSIYLEPETDFYDQRKRNSFLRETNDLEKLYAGKNGLLKQPDRAEIIHFNPDIESREQDAYNQRLEHIIYGNLKTVFDWDGENRFKGEEKRVYNDFLPKDEPITRTLDTLAYTLQRAKLAK